MTKLKHIILLTTLLCCSSGLLAKIGRNVYTVHDCKRLRHWRPHPFLLVLYKDEPLIDSIQQCMHDARLKSAVISSGIGTLNNVTLSYYDKDDKKKFLDRYFKGPFELVTLTGNVTWNHKHPNPQVHIHATLGRRNYSVIGGHLKDAMVTVNAEMLIRPFSTRFVRYPDPDLDEIFLIGNEY